MHGDGCVFEVEKVCFGNALDMLIKGGGLV